MSRLAGPRYLVGIDLGTVNSALASVDLAAEPGPLDALAAMPIPQLVGPGETAARRLLPSSAYVPGEHELPPGATHLPWGDRAVVVGEWAREQGARVPGRLITSAKSWLSHARVDRTAAILPWGAPEGVPRISPVSASALYLRHLREAWDFRHPGAPLAEQEVVLTVPASFDEVARELTVRAAREAGLGKLTLLEEPQAAFYDFTARHRTRLAGALGDSRIVLVCDVGGGTSDFTLLHARLEGESPSLERLAVGEHLLLGGDNVDVTLARRAEVRIGERLDAARWSMLVQACRLAKERLLSAGGPEQAVVSVLGRGSRLIESARSVELAREEVREVLLDGFFPRVGRGERPRKAGRAGLQELGLPYVPDPAVTRHVLAFLEDHAAEVEGALGRRVGGPPRPDAILVNGGVFTPPEVRQRLVEVVSSWFPGEPAVRLLESEALDVAVARGAAYSALVRRGLGLRIGGGTPRAYYVGIEAQGEREQALCVIPRHFEEGAMVRVPRTFALRLDQPARFPLFATTRARFERPGEWVPLDDTFSALPPIETVLRSGTEAKRGTEVPVRLEAALTEIGTLELWCAAEDRDVRWKLEFQLRAGAQESARSEVSPMPRRFGEARALVELYYGKKPVLVERKDVKGLSRALEKVLGARDTWTTPVCRELWAALHAGQGKRRRTVDHERQWLSLTGYCLRPGFGAPLDAWRAAETFKAFPEGLQFQSEPHNWQAWWVMWRRIAGGLDAGMQRQLWEKVEPALRRAESRRVQPKRGAARIEAEDEMIRLGASLERIEPARKAQAAEWVLDRVEREGPAPYLLWAVGRLGARVPFYGSGHACVPPAAAESLVDRLLASRVPRRDLAFPLAQLARLSGDRARDLEPGTRERVIRALEEGMAPDTLLRPVRELVQLGGEDEQRIFGESLPAGLRLLTEDQAPGGPAPKRHGDTPAAP